MSSVQDILKMMGFLETTDGKNLDHKTMEDGLHAGDTAHGTFGLMPNTIKEMANRRRLNKDADELDKAILQAPNEHIPVILQKNPLAQQRYAETMAEKVSETVGDDLPLAAIAWRYGHNLPKERLMEILQQNPGYAKRIQEAMNLKNIGREPAAANFNKTQQMIKQGK